MNFFPIENKPAEKKRKQRVITTTLQRELVPYTEFTDEELYAAKGGILVFDLEIYPNYFLAAFQCFYTKKVVYFEQSETYSFDKHKLLWLMHNFCLVGFNSNNFDLPLLWLALQPKITTENLKFVTNEIINGSWRSREVEQAFKFKMGQINSIDLIEVAPLTASLKTYGGRLHAPRLQDLPFNPELILSASQCIEVREYCINDLELTSLLLNELQPQLELRSELSSMYGHDLRSKSDAQIAEAVICSEVSKITGRYPKRQIIESGTSFKYNIPSYIEYKTPVLKHMLEVVRNAVFVVRESGKVLIPDEIDKLQLNVGHSSYNLTIGGLHSTESSVSYFSDETVMLADFDVESYYPRIVLNLNLYPENMGLPFNTVYDIQVISRLDDKKNGRKKKADSKKIVVNGGFGKLGSKWSAFYSPNLMITVTMTGQLSLLMLIEAIELVGIPVVSGNTDGIVMLCPRNRYNELLDIIADWEIKTRFKMEETRYKSIHSRDVNNYFALKLKFDKQKNEWLDEVEECKVKGCYAERGSALNSVLSKNPKHLVCSDAVINLLTKNIPIEQTIIECQDIRRFVSLINVKGGAEKDGIYLGKVCRFYYAKNVTGCINYVMNGNKVPETDNSKPLMDLPALFPNDIDYEKYVNETVKILTQVGYIKTEKQHKFF